MINNGCICLLSNRILIKNSHTDVDEEVTDEYY